MLKGHLYQRPKSATQSGKANTQEWIIEILDKPSFFKEDLVGWWGSNNTLKQIKLCFKTRAQALLYAQKHQLNLMTEDDSRPSSIKPKSYADNFRADRTV